MKTCTICSARLLSDNITGLCLVHLNERRRAASRAKQAHKDCKQCGEPEPRGSRRKGDLCRPCICKNAAARKPVPLIEEQHQRTIASLIATASQITLIPREELTGQRRFRVYTRIRQAIMYLAREDGHSFPFIGNRLGKRDHSTICHGWETARNRLMCEPEYAAFVARLNAEAGEWAA